MPSSVDSLVLMADGTTKRAEEVVVGDVVKATDTDTGKVVDVCMAATERAKLTFGDLEHVCSIHHRLSVDGKGWVAAKDMEVGDVVSGHALTAKEDTEYGLVMFVTVEGHETYFADGLFSHSRDH